LSPAFNSLPAWAPTSHKKPPQGVGSSLGSALLIELSVVGAVLVWLVMHPPQELEQVIPLVMSMLEDPKVDKPLPPKPPEIKPPPVPAKVVPMPAKPQTPVTPEARPVPEVAPPVVAQATAFSTPVVAAASPAPPPPPPPPPVVSPPAPAVDPALIYYGKLTAAVQAAFVVPGPASALGFKGRARVEFHLRDGVASNAKILQPSGLGAVDRAALKAVEAAAFPPPPPALAGKDGVYQIWVACF
jgi:protein TonB